MSTENVSNEEKGNGVLADVMPSIGYRYFIIENGRKIWGVVDSYEGTGFFVRWNDGTMTHEEKCDNAR